MFFLFFLYWHIKSVIISKKKNSLYRPFKKQLNPVVIHVHLLHNHYITDFFKLLNAFITCERRLCVQALSDECLLYHIRHQCLNLVSPPLSTQPTPFLIFRAS